MSPPIELILARNLLTYLASPAVLLDADGHLVFYNAQAGVLIGQPFEETGPVAFAQWAEPAGGEDSTDVAEELALFARARAGRSAQADLRIASATGGRAHVHATAVPLVTQVGFVGAIVLLIPDADPLTQG